MDHLSESREMDKEATTTTSPTPTRFPSYTARNLQFGVNLLPAQLLTPRIVCILYGWSRRAKRFSNVWLYMYSNRICILK